MNKIKIKTKARRSEDVNAFKNWLKLNKEQNPRRKCLTSSKYYMLIVDSKANISG